ncbi:MAG: MarR family transcriptional regulator [Actinobacteria bacterium]|nr:MarR family transcriptional regulator [Actinomycetota bacterium]
MATKQLTDKDFQRLLELWTELRTFLRENEERAEQLGITPAQHQLMLAIRGHSDSRGPSITQVARYLLLRHHSVVGLIDRAEEAGLVERRPDGDDHRVVRLRLTRKGNGILQRMNTTHAEALARLEEVTKGLRKSAS